MMVSRRLRRALIVFALWQLGVIVAIAQSPSTNMAVLSTDVSVSPTSPTANSPMTYTVAVRNRSSLQATNVTLTSILPASFGTVSASAPGTCSVNCLTTGFPSIVTCSMGSVGGSSNATATITGTPTATGAQSALFSVAANEFDTDLSDNAVQNTTTINPEALPTISGLNPGNGSTNGGTSVIVSGSNFKAGATVTFGGTAAAVVSVNVPSQITVTTPGHSPGSNLPVQVTNPGPPPVPGPPFYSFTYNCPSLSISPFSLPAGTASVSYNQQLTVRGGAAPYSFAGVSGALPPGLTLSSGGVLSGTPTTPGNFSFTVTAADAYGCTGSQSYTVGISPSGGTSLYTLVPCRVVDTRDPSRPYGPPSLQPSETRTYALAGRCGIPASAKSILVNMTVTNVTAEGNWTIYPGNVSPPNTSSINFTPGVTRANNAHLAVAPDGSATIKVLNLCNGTDDFILDVVGYFQ